MNFYSIFHFKSTVRPYNQWGRNLFTRTTATPTTAVAISRPRVTAPIYQARLEMDVDQCSPYQPAGILPGSGQSRPRWISSGKITVYYYNPVYINIFSV